MANIADKTLGKPQVSAGEVEIIPIEDFDQYRVVNFAVRNLSTRPASSVAVYIEGAMDALLEDGVTPDPDTDFWYTVQTGNVEASDGTEYAYPSGSGAHFTLTSDLMVFDRLQMRLVSNSQHDADVAVAAYGEART